MNVLINPINGMVVISTGAAIAVDIEHDVYVVPGHVIYDPRPSSGVGPVEMEFPEESFCEYQIQAGKPVRIVPKPALPVPSAVSMRQARLALLSAGHLADVEAAIYALPEPARSAAKIEWDYAVEVPRNWPTITVIAPTLGLDDAALDNLFRLAATL